MRPDPLQDTHPRVEFIRSSHPPPPGFAWRNEVPVRQAPPGTRLQHSSLMSQPSRVDACGGCTYPTPRGTSHVLWRRRS